MTRAALPTSRQLPILSRGRHEKERAPFAGDYGIRIRVSEAALFSHPRQPRMKQPRLTYWIEKRPADAMYTSDASARYALRVTRHEGGRLWDFSCVHFSTAKTRATLRRRVKRLFPEAIEI